eukprot:TRINITY_DN19680_c0_g1_i1.p1 TRINITY_DN19680_c0_g1~~TRINITY_DN19680_c0_g1_i1.p1  ORF type:complete len:242 (-),score=60.38 TRINITY_DN19680_c0_g1_i1:91-816(-)
MCIRDRYQRRVHGELSYRSNEYKLMRTSLLPLVALILVLAPIMVQSLAKVEELGPFTTKLSQKVGLFIQKEKLTRYKPAALRLSVGLQRFSLTFTDGEGGKLNITYEDNVPFGRLIATDEEVVASFMAPDNVIDAIGTTFSLISGKEPYGKVCAKKNRAQIIFRSSETPADMKKVTSNKNQDEWTYEITNGKKKMAVVFRIDDSVKMDFLQASKTNQRLGIRNLFLLFSLFLVALLIRTCT